MNRKSLLVCSVLLLMGCLQSFAQEFLLGDLRYQVLSYSDQTVEVCSEQDPSLVGDIDIPDQVFYDGVFYSVTSIAPNAFLWCQDVTGIQMHEGLMEIGDGAFMFCTSLASLAIPASVTSIGSGITSGCSSLEWITVADGNAVYDSRGFCNAIIETSSGRLIAGCRNSFIFDGVTAIGEAAFNGIDGLTAISIPGSVTTIEDYAFMQCFGLTTVDMSYGVQNIGSSAFYGCADLSEIVIPSSVNSIGGNAFFNCVLLKNIYIPASVTSIGYGVFSHCTALESLNVDESNPVYTSAYGANVIIEKSTSTLLAGTKATTIPSFVKTIGDMAFSGCDIHTINIPTSVSTIGWSAFEGCFNLESIDIPGSVTYIGDMAFADCYNLSHVSLPLGITSIGDYTFAWCFSLNTIEIPSGVTSIGVGAFCGSENLRSIKWMQKTPDFISEDVFGGASWGGEFWTNILIPDGAVQNFLDAGWGDHAGLFEEKPTDGLFYYEVLSEKLATAGVTCCYSINADGYMEKNIYEGSLEVPEQAYINGKWYTVTEICDYAFEDCMSIYNSNGELLRRGLEAITLPNTIQRIGLYAFSQTDLKSISIPSSVTTMGGSIDGSTIIENPFALNDHLQSITVEDGNPVYDSRGGCNAIINTANNELVVACHSTVIPSTVKSIGSMSYSIGSSYMDNTAPELHVIIPDGVTEIKGEAFSESRYLAGIQIPASVKKIGNAAFSDCQNLKSVELPDALTAVEDGTFSFCNALQSVKLPANLTRIGDVAFWFCRSLESVDFPQGLREIGYGAFAFSGLREVVLPGQIERLDHTVFQNCGQLKNIFIPASLQYAGALAFYSPALLSVTVNADEPPAIDPLAFCNDSDSPLNSEAVLYVPENCKEKYRNAEGWKVFPCIEEMTTVTDGVYYVQNVESGLFLTRGYDGGFHAAVGEIGMPVRVDKQTDNSYTFTFTRGSVNSSQLYRANQENVYVDYGWQPTGCPFWNIDDAGNGTYYIRSLTSHSAYGQAALPNTCLGTDDGRRVTGNVQMDGGQWVKWRFVPATAHAPSDPYERYMTLIRSLNRLGIDGKIAEELFGSYVGPDEYDYVFKLSLDKLKNALKGDIKDEQLPVDITSLINNPSFDLNNTVGWTVECADANWRNEGSQAFNNWGFFNTAFNISQTISGLPNGIYTLKMRGYYRPQGSSEGDIRDYWADTNPTDALLYANDATVPVKDMATGISSELLDGHGMELNLDGNIVYVPNCMNDARVFFKAGYYENELTFNVTDGTATIGVRLDKGGNDRWVVFDDFRLIYQKSPDTDISQMANAVYVEPAEVYAAGVATLKVNLKNSQPTGGLQFDLVLPDGVNVMKDADGFPMAELSLDRTTKKKTNKFTAVEQPKGDLRVTAASTNGSTFSGNEGVVATVKVSIDKDVPPGFYSMELKNVSISGNGIDWHNVPSVKTTLAVSSGKLGDANDDGNVDFADFMTLAYHILDRQVLRFNERNADANSDGKVNVADYTAVAHLMNYGSVVRPAAPARALAPDKVKTADLTTLNDVLYVMPVKASVGQELTLSVKMKNSVAAEGFGFDLLLPKGMTVVTDAFGFPETELSFERTSDKQIDTFDSNVIGDGSTLRVLATSTQGYTIGAGDGEVARIKVKVGDNMSYGKYVLALKNIVVVDAQAAESLDTDVFETTVDIGGAVGVDGLRGGDDSVNAQWYDLQGRRVSAKGKDAKKGVYLRNGKKLVVK